MAAKCPNCLRWSAKWQPGWMCPECSNGADRATGNPAKVLTKAPPYYDGERGDWVCGVCNHVTDLCECGAA